MRLETFFWKCPICAILNDNSMDFANFVPVATSSFLEEAPPEVLDQMPTAETSNQDNVSNILHWEDENIFTVPEHFDESSVIVNKDFEPIAEDFQLTFTKYAGSTKRGSAHLVSNDGHSYVVSRHRNNATYWTCVKKNKSVKCAASVVE